MLLHSLGFVASFYSNVTWGTLHDNMRLEEASQTNSFPSLPVLDSEIKGESETGPLYVVLAALELTV